LSELRVRRPRRKCSVGWQEDSDVLSQLGDGIKIEEAMKIINEVNNILKSRNRSYRLSWRTLYDKSNNPYDRIWIVWNKKARS